MRSFNILSLLLLSFFYSTGQGVLTPDWTKFNSSSNGTSEAWGIDVDDDQNIYWTVTNDNRGQGLDIISYKFEQGGNSLWSTPFTYGGPGTQHAYVSNVADDALYIGGKFCTGLFLTCNMSLLKVDKTTGRLIWDRMLDFSASGYDEVDGLEIMPDGIYCGGWSQEFNGSPYQNEIGLWKLDFDGNTEWTNYLGVDGTSEHQDGHFVVDEDRIYAAGLWGGSGLFNLYNGHAFLGSFSKSNGTLIDSTLFGTQSTAINDIENALGMASDGDYLYITGYSTPRSVNDWQIFVAKFDKQLNQIWYTDWGGSGSESARAIDVEDGIIYIAGLTESPEIMIGGDSDGVFLTMDTSGNVLDYKIYGGAEHESFQDIKVSDGNVYFTGTIRTRNPETKRSMLLALEDNTNSNELAMKDQFVISPNPSRGKVVIDFKNPVHSNGEVQAFDSSGKLVAQGFFESSTSKYSLNLPDPGIFLIQVVFEDYTITHKVFNRP